MAGHSTDSWVSLHVLRTLGTTFLWCLRAGMLVAAPLRAQAIIGTLVEAETRAPVEGASIVLLNLSGDQVDWRLTDAVGRFNFQMSRAGTYVLRADRIGHASVLSDPISVDRGVTVVHRMETPVEAIRLAGIEVSSSRRCEIRPGRPWRPHREPASGAFTAT